MDHFQLFEKSVFHSQNQLMYTSCVSSDSLLITLRTLKTGVSSCRLHYSDRFVLYELQCVPMTGILRGTSYDYYSAVITDRSRRFKYFFEIGYCGETYYYTLDGIQKEFPRNVVGNSYFQFPHINKNDLYDIPEWAHRSVFYQIFPDRFHRDPLATSSADPLKEWDELPGISGAYGGNLQGIIDRLDHLADLGVSCIYLTPIFRSSSYHRYDIADYYEIDPLLGDKATFRELVRRCHDRKIRVILDGVFNHTSNEFFAFQDVIRNGCDSKYSDWYDIYEYPVQCAPSANYATFAVNIGVMPRLNTSNPEVREYFIEVGKYWVREFDIDGWRLDVADEVDDDLWKEFRKSIRAIKKDVFIVGEVWYDATNWLKGDQFDSIMNYPLRELGIDFFIHQKITPDEFSMRLADIMVRYPPVINANLLNLIGSHDTARILTIAGGRADKVDLLYSFLFTFTGIPMIYYGDEVGVPGNDDFDSRRTMPWDEDAWVMEIRDHIRSLARFRREHQALSGGGFRQLRCTESVFAFERKRGAETLLVAFNVSGAAAAFDPNSFFGEGAKITMIFPGRQSDGPETGEMPGFSCRVYRAEGPG